MLFQSRMLLDFHYCCDLQLTLPSMANFPPGLLDSVLQSCSPAVHPQQASLQCLFFTVCQTLHLSMLNLMTSLLLQPTCSASPALKWNRASLRLPIMINKNWVKEGAKDNKFLRDTYSIKIWQFSAIVLQCGKQMWMINRKEMNVPFKTEFRT